jgi:hypothetical protein
MDHFRSSSPLPDDIKKGIELVNKGTTVHKKISEVG